VRNGARLQYTAQHEQQVRARTASVWLRRAGPCGSGTSGAGNRQAVLPAAVAGRAAGEGCRLVGFFGSIRQQHALGYALGSRFGSAAPKVSEN
jgi:hypothetical protein